MGPFFGPLAGWELRRLARRGIALRACVLFAYTLFAVTVAFAGIVLRPHSPRDLFAYPLAAPAGFGEQLALILLFTQLAAVVAITPALGAASVAGEKDRHTLAVLLTTPLTDAEIVFGKAAGQLAFALVMLVAGLPVFALTLLFGGAGLWLCACGGALTAGTAVLCVSVGLHAACETPDLRSALVRGYARVAVLACGAFVPPLVWLTPFNMLLVSHRTPPGAAEVVAGFGYPVVQLLLAGLFLWRAARSLRLREPGLGPHPATAFPVPPRPAPPPLVPPPAPPRAALPPVDDANPVLWKERCVGWRPGWVSSRAARVFGAFAATLAGVLLVAGVWVMVQRVRAAIDPAEAERLARRPGAPDPAGWLLVGAAVCAGGRYLLPLAVGLSAAIAGERRRGTLDSLLTAPLDRRTLLRAKVQAQTERGSGFAAAAVAAVGMAFTADGGVRLGIAAALLVAAGMGLVVGLAAWLTVRCAGELRAFRLLLPVAALAVSWPVGAWGVLWSGVGVTPLELTAALFGVAAACGVAGLVLWWLAGRRLDRGD